ncbi:antitermination protein [Entomohabitans teleogrylli]|uniref:antitermination protein Q n=1 Tax=Entomohabitans teleogrylli TaxID=1384589 RepID=UPI00073D576A|nr:antitermination protein [Entomohabitans teleogrylli]
MNIESLPKYYSPKSPKLNDSTPATGGDVLTTTDVMAAQGMVQAEAPLGFNLFLSKVGVQSPDKAVSGLVDEAMKISSQCRHIEDLEEEKKCVVIGIIARYAYADYSRSAASVRECDCCNGEGFIDAEVFTNKVQFPDGKPPAWAKCTKGVLPSYWEEWRSVREKARVLCPACKGKKILSNACRCHGRGRVVDEAMTREMRGVPVFKECDKCSGRGYSRLTFSTVKEALNAVWPELKRKIAYESVRPFYERIVSVCFEAESSAGSALRKVTR